MKVNNVLLLRGSKLNSTAEFESAILLELDIEVWKGGQIMDYAGVIQNITDDTVTCSNGAMYLKSECEFIIH